MRFGRVTASGRGSETSIAPDRRALTTTFSDFEVTVDPEPAEPDPTKTFTMTMPLTTGRGGETLSVYAQGFIFLDGGAKASVTLQGGGRQIIQGYATGADDSFLQTLELPARPGVTYQLTFAIDIDRGADAEGTGYLNIAAIDIGSTDPRQRPSQLPRPPRNSDRSGRGSAMRSRPPSAAARRPGRGRTAPAPRRRPARPGR